MTIQDFKQKLREHKPSRDIERAYRNHEAIAQSDLEPLVGYGGGAKISTLAKGNLIDIYTLTPKIASQYYYIETINTTLPEGKMVDLYNLMIQKIGDEPNPEFSFTIDDQEKINLLNQCRQEVNYNSKLKQETFLRKMFEEYQIPRRLTNYYRYHGRIPVQQAQRDDAQMVASRLRTAIHEQVGTQPVGFQLPLFVELHNVPCKCLLDYVFLNKEGKVQFVDLKWTGVGLDDYHFQARRLHIDFQQSFYYTLLCVLLGEENVAYPQLLVYSQLDDDFKFMQLTKVDMEIGAYGFRKKIVMELPGSNTEVTFFNPRYGWIHGLNIKKGNATYNHVNGTHKHNGIWF